MRITADTELCLKLAGNFSYAMVAFLSVFPKFLDKKKPTQKSWLKPSANWVRSQEIGSNVDKYHTGQPTLKRELFPERSI